MANKGDLVKRINKFIPAVLAVAAALMAGCQFSTTATPNTAGQPSARCDSKAVRHLVGQIATPELLDQAKDQAGARTARILRPDDIVTLEYNSQRLNINTDSAMKIERINCG